MKKLLVLLMVLGTASWASAAFEFQTPVTEVNPATGPDPFVFQGVIHSGSVVNDQRVLLCMAKAIMMSSPAFTSAVVWINRLVPVVLSADVPISPIWDMAEVTVRTKL